MRKSFLAAAFAALLAAPAGADPAADGAQAWRTLTRIDLEAHYQLLKRDHPGASSEAGDPAFVEALEAAHAEALGRADRVTTLTGYAATLAGFVHALGDSHINSYMSVLPRTVDWTGIVAARRGAGWVVAADEPKLTGRELAGAEIVSCDSRPVADLAKDVLRFHANPAVAAEQALFGGWLLVDDGNPFLKRPTACVLRKDGVESTQTLTWKPISYAALRQQYWKTPIGHAGFGVRPVAGGGYWISLEELDAKDQPVIDAVKAQAAAIRDAAFVVVDLRGDGGGDDAYGRALATALMGEGFVDDVLGPSSEGGGCASVFRVTPGNAAFLTRAARSFGRNGDATAQKEYEKGVADIAAARARGRDLTGPPRCAGPAKPPVSRRRPSLAKAPILVLSDAACFSSCINTVWFFRDLGAIQVGQATDSDTHYSEVRDMVLPSGLSTATLLTAIIPDAPPRIGPFEPKFAYGGDIAATADLEAWVAGQVVPQLKRQGAAAWE